MMRCLLSLLRSLAVLALLLSAGGCDLSTVQGEKTSSATFQGSVAEFPSQQPIAGAHVVGMWVVTHSALVDAQDFCEHVESAVTDAQGHYQMATWSGFKPSYVFIYKTGYTDSIDSARGMYRQIDRYSPLQEPFKGMEAERFNYLVQKARNFSCDTGGQSKRNSLPAYEALFAEAKGLAVTSEDRRNLEWIRGLAARNAVAEDNDQQIPSYEIERRNAAFLQDHLQLPYELPPSPQPTTIVPVPARMFAYDGANPAPLAAAHAPPVPVQVAPQNQSPSKATR